MSTGHDFEFCAWIVFWKCLSIIALHETLVVCVNIGQPSRMSLSKIMCDDFLHPWNVSLHQTLTRFHHYPGKTWHQSSQVQMTFVKISKYIEESQTKHCVTHFSIRFMNDVVVLTVLVNSILHFHHWLSYWCFGNSWSSFDHSVINYSMITSHQVSWNVTMSGKRCVPHWF